MPKGDGYGGRKAQGWVRSVLNTYGTTCHLCHHPGADSADHIRTRAERPDLMFVVTNGRPVHHKPCPVCARTCNISRKDKPITTTEPVNDVGFFESGPTR